MDFMDFIIYGWALLTIIFIAMGVIGNSMIVKDAEEFYKKKGIPKDTKLVKYLRGIEEVKGANDEGLVHLWIEDNILCIMRKPNFERDEYKKEVFRVRHIPLKDIEYFTIHGETLANVSSKGASVTGAIIGGVVAGGVGAVVGSQKNNKVETTFIDNRDTIVVCKVNGVVERIEFEGDYVYNELISRIPEKDYEYKLQAK